MRARRRHAHVLPRDGGELPRPVCSCVPFVAASIVLFSLFLTPARAGQRRSTSRAWTGNHPDLTDDPPENRRSCARAATLSLRSRYGCSSARAATSPHGSRVRGRRRREPRTRVRCSAARYWVSILFCSSRLAHCLSGDATVRADVTESPPPRCIPTG